MRSVRWGALGVSTGAALGSLLLFLLFRVPGLIAVVLGVAAVAVTCFSWWADRLWKKRMHPERRT